ncbi:hypothetical protein Micbo1qcDRAFT_159535, partial [Microdochium bolleyi]
MRRPSGMRSTLALPRWPVLSAVVVAAALATASQPAHAAPESTCIARSVNYITHSLPQQCLTSFPTATTAA